MWVCSRCGKFWTPKNHECSQEDLSTYQKDLLEHLGTWDIPPRIVGIRPKNEQEIENAKKLSYKGGLLRAFYYDKNTGLLHFSGHDHEREYARAFLRSDGGRASLQWLCEKLNIALKDMENFDD